MNNLEECGSVVIWSGHTVDTLSHVDGDCACPLPRSRADSEVRALPGGLDSTWWAAPVVEVPLDEAHIALVIATKRGGVAVLNQSAYGVWDQIRRYHQVLPGDPIHTRFDVLAVIRQLWQAGLVLTAPYEPPVGGVSDVLQVWLHMNSGLQSALFLLLSGPARRVDVGRGWAARGRDCLPHRAPAWLPGGVSQIRGRRTPLERAPRARCT